VRAAPLRAWARTWLLPSLSRSPVSGAFKDQTELRLCDASGGAVTAPAPFGDHGDHGATAADATDGKNRPPCAPGRAHRSQAAASFLVAFACLGGVQPELRLCDASGGAVAAPAPFGDHGDHGATAADATDAESCPLLRLGAHAIPVSEVGMC
jgi:hypothetical protein